MLRPVLIVVSGLLALLVSACSAEDLQDRMLSIVGEDITADADAVIEAVTAKDGDAIRALTHPDVRSYFTDEAMQPVFDEIPDAAPIDRKLVSWSMNTNTTVGEGSLTTTELTYILNFDPELTEVQRASFTMRFQARNDEDAGLVFVNFTDRTMSADAQQTSMTPILTGVAIGLAAFTFISLLAAIFTPRLKRRILWSLFIVLFGTPVFAFVTPGETWQFVGPGVTSSGSNIRLQLLEFRLFSASYMTNAITGLTQIDLAIPLGALLFWVQRLRGKLARKPMKQAEPTATPPAQDTPSHDA